MNLFVKSDTMNLFLYEFDVSVGPKLIKSVLCKEYSKEIQKSITCAAFPESAIQMQSNSALYTFKIGTEFFYTLFMRREDPKQPRGHRQNSFIIATERPYYTPFMHFLASSVSMDALDAVELFDLIHEFLKKWVDKIPTEPLDCIDLPMFVGSLPVSYPRAERDVFNEGSYYVVNDCFVDIDLCQALEIHELKKYGRTGDILALWEAAVLGESVFVIGSSASSASNAALSIGSLAYPIQHDRVVPYISPTDERFETLLLRPGIVGVANPVTARYRDRFEYTLTVGFGNDKVGLNRAKCKWEFLSGLQHVTSKTVRRELYTNMLRVKAAIARCFRITASRDPYAACAGSLSAEDLEECLVEENVSLCRPPFDFARKLLRSKLLVSECHNWTKDEALVDVVRKLSICRMCAKMDENEKVQLYANIETFRKYCSQTQDMLALLDNHLSCVKLSLCPELVLE